MFRVRSLRLRIALSYILGAVLVSGLVAFGTYVITARVLVGQVIDSSKSQTFDELTFLKDRIESGGTAALSSHLGVLQQRGSDVVATVPGRTADSTSVGVALKTIPAELQEAVEGGDVGYAVFEGPGHRQLAFGSRVPATTTPVFVYFVYSMEGVDQTLELLWQVLIGVVAAAAIIAGAVGLRLADRTTRPLRAAADAARKVAEGGLDTRLSEEGEDELARLAADFNRMTQALELRIARELQFVSDVSHELRTPLTTLKTSIDYIAERVEGLPPRLSQAVGLATDEVRALSRLVNDLLELTRAEAGGVHVSSDEVDLRDFATEIVRRRAPETDVDIEGPEHLVVRTDKSRLERVVGNLVENAVMHGGGQQVRITLDRSNGAATITVADNGPGISAEEISHIFDRFWRGDRARQRDGKVGAGLGMSIAKENAKLIGAELKVDSTPGQGTRFHVVLPRRIPE